MGLAKLSSLELLHLRKHRIGPGVGTWFDLTQKQGICSDPTSDGIRSAAVLWPPQGPYLLI